MLYFSCIMLNPSVRRGLSPLLFVRSSGIKGYTLPRAKTNNAYELISSLKVFFTQGSQNLAQKTVTRDAVFSQIVCPMKCWKYENVTVKIM